MSRYDAMDLFVAAVRGGSFSEAARQAGVTPGAVSRRISALETRLGVQLLSRSTRKLMLTEAGRSYFQRVEKLLEDLDEAEALASALQSTPKGRLTVHSRSMFGVTVLAPLIPRFQSLHPEIRVELRISERQISLRDEDCDLDFQVLPPREKGLMQRKLFASERMLVASPRYIERYPRVLVPQDLEAHNCLTYLIGGQEPVWRIRGTGQTAEIVVPSGFSSNSGLVLLDLAMQGHGIALLDDYTVIDAIAAGMLVRLLPAYQATNTTFDAGIFALYQEAKNLSQKIRVFLDYVVEEIRPLLLRRKSVLAAMPST